MTAPLSRRTLLRGLGGVAVGLPFLGAMLRPGRSIAQPSTIPKRLIVCFRSNGVVPERWFPTDFSTGSAGSAADFWGVTSPAPQPRPSSEASLRFAPVGLLRASGGEGLRPFEPSFARDSRSASPTSGE